MERIARAVVRRDDEILLAGERAHSYWFLPGGHIEAGERAEDALVREFAEELGIEVRVGRFVGTLQNSYVDRQGRARSEVNFVYEASIDDTDLISQEEHLEFAWVPLDQLVEADFRPAEMKVLMRQATS